MLYLTRKIGETVVVNENIKITVMDVHGKSIKLGFEYPNGATVLRKELFERIQDENEAASLAACHLAAHLGEAS